MPRVSSVPRSVYEPTSDYTRHRQAPIPDGYVAVQRTQTAVVHLVRAETFGAVAKQVLAGTAATLCGMPLHAAWRLTPKTGETVSCHKCRYHLRTT